MQGPSCDRIPISLAHRTCRLAWAVLLLGPASLPAQDVSSVRIEIRGLNPELERNVRAVLELARAAERGKLTHQRITRLHHRAEEDIDVALRPFGYYRPSIYKSLEPAADAWVARYSIDPGPPVKVRSVKLELSGPGAELPFMQQAAGAFPLHQGDTLRDPFYEAGKLAILKAATDSGYLDANFDTTAVLVDRTNGTADVLIRFHTGPRYKFGAVRFEQDVLDESFLRTRVRFKPGEPFAHYRLVALQNALAEDPYFARVEVLPERNAAQDLEVPIRVLLEPRRAWTHEVGAGYGTDTGPRVRGNSILRRINRKGHNAEGELLLSQIDQTVGLRYNIPGVLHTSGVLTFFAGVSRLVPRISDSRTLMTGARLFRKRLGWRETISLSYQRTNFEIGVDTARASLVVAGFNYERTRADNRIFPRRGIRTQIELQGAQKALLSSTTFLSLKGSAKVVSGLLPRARLLARAELGHIYAPDFHAIPPELRFFTGGDLSVRGFGYLRLGPTDSLGNVIGGATLAVGSVELDYQVMPRWAVAVFTDAGNAMAGSALTGLQHSVGGGIRFISPIGLLRVDGAVAISRKHRPFRLHISVGTDL